MDLAQTSPKSAVSPGISQESRLSRFIANLTEVQRFALRNFAG